MEVTWSGSSSIMDCRTKFISGWLPCCLGAGAPLLPRRLDASDLTLLTVEHDHSFVLLTYALTRGEKHEPGCVEHPAGRPAAVNLRDGPVSAQLPPLQPEGGYEETDRIVRRVHRPVAETPQVTGPIPRHAR